MEQGIIYVMSKTMADKTKAAYNKDRRFKNASLEDMVNDSFGLLRKCVKVEVN